jgi:transposase-like protein
MATAIYTLANRVLRGQLPRRLREARKDGISYRRLAEEFNAEGIPVSHETIRQWVRQLNIEEKVERAS